MGLYIILLWTVKHDLIISNYYCINSNVCFKETFYRIIGKRSRREGTLRDCKESVYIRCRLSLAVTAERRCYLCLYCWPHNVNAVSYTHLDVYKRQVIHTVRNIRLCNTVMH